MASESALSEFAALLGHEVNFTTKSGKLSRGVLTHIFRNKQHLYSATIRVKSKLPWTKNETVPINHIMKDVNVPVKPKIRDDKSSIRIPTLGLYEKCLVHGFKVGDSVIWSQPEAPPGAGLVGVIRFIGNGANHSSKQVSTMAVVNFQEPTSALPYFLGGNSNAVPIQHLQLLPIQQETQIATGSNVNGSHSPRALELSKVSQSDVDLDNFKKYSDVNELPKSSENFQLPRTYADATKQPLPSTSNHQSYANSGPPTHVSAPLRNPSAKQAVKGIQGGNNSCYIDASLFALFAYNTNLDSYLQSKEGDNEATVEVKVVLRERILKPLRESQYVPSENIQVLRDIFIKNVSAQYSFSFMDAEEFLLSLFGLLRIPELFQYDNEVSDHIHQTILPEGWSFRPDVTVQHLLEKSFQESSVKLTYVPTCFIVKLPVSNGVLVSCDAVIPNLTLDLKPLLCEEIANSLGEETPKLYLSSVVCLRNNHFVTFAKNGVHDDSPWFFMDSNPTGSRPELVEVKELHSTIQTAEELYQSTDGKMTERHCQNRNRLIRDAYICVYITK